MTIRSVLGIVGAAALAATVTVPGSAQPLDRNTTFTFNTPVTVPGVTLPAGSYRFRLATTPPQNHVQVSSADGRTSYAIFFAFATERHESIATADVQFLETAPGIPPAIKTWWYPGTTGYEFIYSREQRRLLSAGAPAAR